MYSFRQLSQQTYIATYYCIVDCCLLSQFFYYGGDPKLPPGDGFAPRSRTASIVRPHSLDASHYRTLSAAAESVAAAAARAAHPETKHPHRHTREEQPLHGHNVAPEVHDEAEDAGLLTLADSFHSESGNRKRVSWSQEHQPHRPEPPTSPVLHSTHPSLQITSPQLESSALARGRALQRSEDLEEDQEDISTRRAGSRASRRSAGMVFLGIWALFGIGSLTNAHYREVVPKGTGLGTVLSPRMDSIARSVIYHTPFDTSNSVYLEFPAIEGHVGPPVHLQESPTVDRIIGRIFAWLCATLYLTSRLPQIWKNVSVLQFLVVQSTKHHGVVR